MNKKTTQSKEPKRDVKVPVTCMTCLHALLHRYDKNPVLAACKCKPQLDNQRFPYEVEVASSQRVCADYDRDLSEKQIEQRYKHHVA